MIAKRFEDIQYSDLEALLSEGVTEGKTVEYKKETVGVAASDKDKFLGGLSAFANTVGGDFFLGIEAKSGVPTRLCGLDFESADSEILRLEQILQNGLEPRLPIGSYHIKDIKSPAGENFILIRTNKSWVAPHKVKSNEKFYGRNSKGKYPLDVSELRTAFILSEQLSSRVKSFRAERLRKITEDDELPVEIVQGGKIVLHLLPLSAFSAPISIDVSRPRHIWGSLDPINGNGWNGMVNLDGVVSYSRPSFQMEKNEAYTQLFRDGCVEAVGRLTFMDDNLIPSEYYEQQVVRCAKKYCQTLFELGVSTPVYLFLSLMDVKGYSLMVVGSSLSGRPFERKQMLLPEVFIDDFENLTAETLKPIFDMVWNAFGYQRSLNYDAEGKWRLRE
ncbi:MAG: ATP-binding protein [Pyrinomonadaceae bacterium]